MEANAQVIGVSGRKIIPIVPYSVKGKYRNIKTSVMSFAFMTFYALPWLQWQGKNRVGQAIQIDAAHSRMHIFDITLYPQDLLILVAVMVFAAALLFMSAAVYGRIFCGFFCFQTMWTDAFRFIETAVQGEAQARKRLMRQPWSVEKLYKIGATHSLWLLLAFVTGLTFTLYFADARTLFVAIFNGSADAVAYQTIGLLTATTYAAAGIAREEICRVVCPYGKFQSIMQDAATKTVVYDTDRGERSLGRIRPHAGLKDANLRAVTGHGDCIDCNYCVNVCPTGVDIRKGFQIDCISCGLCIDACDTIMKTVNLATGLIRFDTMQAEKGIVDIKAANWSNLVKFGYMAVLITCVLFLAYQLLTLEPFSAVIQQQAQPLVTTLSNGDLKRRYIIRLTNKTATTEHYHVQTDGLPTNSMVQNNEFSVPSGKTYSISMTVILKPEVSHAMREFNMRVVPESRPNAQQEFTLNYISDIR